MAAWGPYLIEWGSIILRWLHVTAAIAWIGGSFFFMHLDASLRKMVDQKPGVAGVSWQVHGGGFYEMSKYTLAPPMLPDHLIWHKWQSYWTWISGFSLLCWVYYGQASFFLIDALLAIVGFGYVVLTSYVFTKLFSGRGALIHTGALMATMMTANVAMIIMPNQRKSVAALLKGQTPDPKWGKESKQRSTHNNYITLPVLFLMLSNHYPLTYTNSAAIPALVTCVIVAGALIRYFYNSWHADHAKAPWWAWGVAAGALWIAFWIAMSASPGMRSTLGLGELPAEHAASADLPKAPDDVVAVVESRCSMCHAAEPVWEGIGEAPKGVRLDSPENIQRFASAIRMQAVLTHAMPPNNLTEITPEERETLARWLGVAKVAEK